MKTEKKGKKGKKVHEVQNNDGKKHKCEDCGRAFSRADNLKRHKLTHAPEPLIACDLCSEKLTFPALGRHRRSEKCAARRADFEQKTENGIAQDIVVQVPTVKQVKIPAFTAEITDVGDGNVSIKHDRIFIDGVSFLLVPEYCAQEILSPEKPINETSLNSLTPPISPVETRLQDTFFGK